MTLLHQTLTLTNLRSAWDAISENQGIAGVDSISIRRWQRNWEARLQKLSLAVRTNQYKPGKLRTRRIPKRDPRQYRTLRIPTVTDRVLQRAVLQILYPIFEPRFLDCSFGYRPGRSLKEAVRHINTVRKQGYTWVLDADIDDFFNQVDHQILLQFLHADLPDNSLMNLINLWLNAGKPDPELAQGIPMGSPISPLFANIVLHRLDTQLTTQGWPLARYADDFIVLSRSENEAQLSYKVVADILQQLNLCFEPHKTNITTFETGFDFLGVHFEEGWYWYLWEDKRIEIEYDAADWLFNDYGPEYE